MKLGRYVIREELGAGGMAVVYRAEDTTLRRDVAIKVLLPHLTRHGELAGRFLREARAAGALDHPGIMKIFDVAAVDEAAGTPSFIVMELIRGRTLKDFLDKRGAPIAEIAAMVGAQLADALHAAHVAGVVHRDVKPANVMITEDGRLILCDFGVARLANDDAVATQSGLVLGTPTFMSPEQALAATVDARSDVYSLGATLYQVATGALPFSGTTAAVISAVTRGDMVPPLRRNPAMGGALSREIGRAMAKDPAGRHESAAELREALLAITRVPGLGERQEELRAYFADPGAWNERARPLVVAAAMTRAETASKRREFARALAECDRVLAIDPQHEAASELVSRVGKGARQSRRVVALGVVAMALVLAGLGSLLVLGKGGRRANSPMMAAGGPMAFADAAVPAAVSDAGAVADAATGAVAVAEPDAGSRVRPGKRPIDAGAAVALVVVPDAAPAVIAPPPPAEPGTLDVQIGPWCDITVDGEAKGRSPGKIKVTPGKHTLVCSQGAKGLSLTREVEVGAGRTEEVKGKLTVSVEVTIDVRADSLTIDGVRYQPGAKVKLGNGQHRVELFTGEKSIGVRHIDIPTVPCTLRDRPELACYE